MYRIARKPSYVPTIMLAVTLFTIGLGLTGCQPQPEPVNGAAGIGDTYYAQLGNGGYDVQNYTLALDVDPTSNMISATETIEANATGRLRSFNLDFQGLTVDTVEVNHVPATFSHQDHELTITPREPLASDRPFSVDITYHGYPEPLESATSFRWIGWNVGWYHNTNGSILVMSEPDGAASWYPVNNHPRDKATYRFEIRVPKPWVAIASGTLREARDEGALTRYVWEMNKPLASYLASISIDKYVLEAARTPAGVVIRNYFAPDTPDGIKKSISMIPDMIEYFSGVFGPYPFDEYGVVVPDANTPICYIPVAEEIQTLSIHCPDMLGEGRIAHELAHQWFGDSVSLKNWQDIWLKEGMATYAEWLWFTRRNMDVKVMNRVVRLKKASYAPTMKTGQPNPDNLYGEEVYTGGALVFHALRLKVGDEAFFKILRTYLERYRYGNAGTDEFIAVAEEVSGQNLKADFNAWLLENKLPDIPEPSK